MPMFTVRQITPVIRVANLDAYVEWWVRHLGFAVASRDEWAEGGQPVAVLMRDGLEVVVEEHARPTQMSLLLEVTDLVSVERAFGDLPRATSWIRSAHGATEIGLHDPEGNLIVFAQAAESTA